ncbi:hypothetical protein EYC80_004237 [Monilinia laxa]|uniref:Uncharacterized protein n=1 Tax=Monilinia laxa TaxID=61186 RepID=A0A5N6KML7_MONLA|nr:hypothetical protein EYC80_004237 [Monilinia laxa]
MLYWLRLRRGENLQTQTQGIMKLAQEVLEEKQIGLPKIETLSFNFQPRNSIWEERSHQFQNLQRQSRQQPRPHNFTVR